MRLQHQAESLFPLVAVKCSDQDFPFGVHDKTESLERLQMESNKLQFPQLQSNTQFAVRWGESALHKELLALNFEFECVVKPRAIRIANSWLFPEERE